MDLYRPYLIVAGLALFALWVPGGAAARGCEVEVRPQGVDVRGSPRVLAGVGHLGAPEVADCAIAANEDIGAMQAFTLKDSF